MEKDYKYYNKRAHLYAILSLVLILCAFLPGIFHVAKPPYLIYIMLVIAFVGIGFYIVSLLNRNKCENLLRQKRAHQKRKAFYSIIELVKAGKTDEAVNALYDYDNKFN